MQSNYCLYFQAHVKKSECWYLTSVLRSIEHLVFDRTIDTEHSIFEFFVPPAMEDDFLRIIAHFEREDVVSDLK